jgi:murein DD-endopeptidase MepM/ murein hydrolase activator NlpD
MIKKVLITLGLLFVIALTIFLFYYYSGTAYTKNIDDNVYALPYAKGASFRVVQGYGDVFSHRHAAALDFDMPVGTPIHAARAGVVYAYKEDSNEGGIGNKYNRKANYIIIQHTDGSFASYVHLKYKGVVKKNGSVQEGELIGYSGATGYALNPHLHFSVKTALNYKMDSYLQTYFYTSGGAKLLKKGFSYLHP